LSDADSSIDSSTITLVSIFGKVLEAIVEDLGNEV
jgi:hypothetical protein